MAMVYRREAVLNVFAFAWLLFVLTNANTALGNAYLHFMTGASFLLVLDKMMSSSVRVTFQKKQGGTVEALLAGGVGWVILLAASYFILNFIEPVKSTFGSIVASLSAANPVFADSVIVNFITVGIVIAYSETNLWARFMEFFGDIFGIPINRQSMANSSFQFLIIVLSLAFVVFHLTAKGISATASLVIVFIMMYVSLMMIAWYDGETRQSVFLHQLANSAATLLAISAGGMLLT